MTRRPSALRRIVAWVAAAGLLAGSTACRTGESALEWLVEARQVSSALRVQFSKASDASNRAVMADTADASTTFAREADEASGALQRDVDALRPLLTKAGYGAEVALLDEFAGRFAKYQDLDRAILTLAVEHTNLKAQRLSFGEARKEADAVRSALDAAVGAAPAGDSWRLKALAATVAAAVMEILALQAPHIAEAEDAAMTRIEGRMRAADTVARASLDALRASAGPASSLHVKTATAAFTAFTEIHGQIVALSRRNSNVRSLALSLGQKRLLVAQCDDTLRALEGALAKRGFPGTR